MGIPWGSIVTAAGSVLGSVLGGDEKTITPYQSMKSAVKFADKYGIHRLTALGANPGYQTVAGSGLGSSVAQGAAALGEGIERERERKRSDNDPLVASQVKVNEAQAELLRFQANRVVQEIQAESRNGTTGALGTRPGAAANIGALVGPAAVNVKDEFGRVHDVTNPDVPMEPEQDLWRWLRQGNLKAKIQELAANNGWSVAAAVQWLDRNAEKADKAQRSWWERQLREIREDYTRWVHENTPKRSTSSKTKGGF